MIEDETDDQVLNKSARIEFGSAAAVRELGTVCSLLNCHTYVRISFVVLSSPSIFPLQPAEVPLNSMQRLNVLRGSPEVPGQNLGSQELREDYSGSSTPPELASEAVDHSEGQALVTFLC